MPENLSLQFFGNYSGVRVIVREAESDLYKERFVSIDVAERYIQDIQDAIEYTQELNPLNKCPYCEKMYHLYNVDFDVTLSKHIIDEHHEE